MKKIIKSFFWSLTVASAAVFAMIAYLDTSLYENYYIEQNETLSFDGKDYLVCSNERSKSSEVNIGSDSGVGSKNVTVSLFGVIPVKRVQVTVTKTDEVLVLGLPFGLKVYSEGAMVVGFNDVDTHNGSINPAVNAGLKSGDIITYINGEYVESSEDIRTAILESGGKTLTLKVKRDDRELTFKITPKQSALDGKYKAGMWLRDSTAGIGTLTFYNPSLDIVAGLGHGICDSDTGMLIPAESGQFVGAEIVGIKKSTADETGELHGIFSGGQMADMSKNSITGVYGVNCHNISGDVTAKIALKQEIKIGKAKILCTLDDEGPKYYDCVIEKAFTNDASAVKNMIIKVTDKDLIAKTGGIVQGMSGSPILQNGKLIGAVTHVFVDDCTKGYAIFAENMLDTAQSIYKEELKAAS